MSEFEKYVMSIDKFKNRKPVFVFQLDENGDYDNRDVYDLHHAWQASASRDGFKMAPYYLLKIIGDALSEKNISSDVKVGIISSAYKDIVGAIE